MNDQSYNMVKNTAAQRQASDIDKHIGSRLRAARLESRLTLEDLAARHGNISYQQIRKYETSQNRITASNLYRMAIILNVPVSYFFAELDADIYPAE